MSMARAKFIPCFVGVTLWIPLSFASTTTDQNKDQGPYINITDTKVLKLTCKILNLEKGPIDKLEVTFRPFNGHNTDTIASIISSNKDINKNKLYPWVEVNGQVDKNNPKNCYLQLTFRQNNTFTGNFTCHVSYGITETLQYIKEISVEKDFTKDTDDSFQAEIFPVHMVTITWISLKVEEIRVYRCVMDRTGNSFKDISLFIKNDRDSPYKSRLVVWIFNNSEYEWNLYIKRDAYDTRNYNYSVEITTMSGTHVTSCFEQGRDDTERERISSQKYDCTSKTIGLSVGLSLAILICVGGGVFLIYKLKLCCQDQHKPEEDESSTGNRGADRDESNAAGNPRRSTEEINTSTTGVTETLHLVSEGPQEDSRDEVARSPEQESGRHLLETIPYNSTSTSSGF